MRILFMEDNQADYQLALRQLRRVFGDLESRQLDSLEALGAALAERDWDVILSDYSIPGLNFREVVAAVQALAPELPLILFSGSVGEEEAVALLKLGVRDFVLKDRPGRLTSALQNALKESLAARAQREAMAALHAAQDREREMERELNHLQRLESIGRLAGGVSHDMNNVLAAIMAVANVLETQFADTPAVAERAALILNASSRGKQLVQGLTDFARKEVMGFVAVDLNQLARKEADLLEHTTLKQVAIQLELEPDLPMIQGEAGALANALMNLCVNACDAMPAGGALRLETRRAPGGHVELTVQDTGGGMPPEVVARAMEPFFTTKPVGHGTGLGLSIVRGTVQAHGGSVAIHSAPGQGTRITLVFPAPEAAPQALPAADAPVPREARPLSLLLVDDDELVRQTVPMLLKTLGHAVQVAGSGAEALARLREGLAADLVILDLNMPAMNGVEALAALRELRPELPVLVASGHISPAAAAAISRYARVGCLAKPFLLDEIRQAVATFFP